MAFSGPTDTVYHAMLALFVWSSLQSEVSQCISKEWKAMSECEKKVFKEQAREDMRRYDLEMIEYRKRVKLQKRQRQREPSNMPKRPMSAFLAFSNKRRAGLKEHHPDATNADLSRMLAKSWKDLDPVLKSSYIEEEAALRKVYNELMVPWQERQKKKKNDAKKRKRARELDKNAAETRQRKLSRPAATSCSSQQQGTINAEFCRISGELAGSPTDVDAESRTVDLSGLSPHQGSLDIGILHANHARQQERLQSRFLAPTFDTFNFTRQRERSAAVPHLLPAINLQYQSSLSGPASTPSASWVGQNLQSLSTSLLLQLYPMLQRQNDLVNGSLSSQTTTSLEPLATSAAAGRTIDDRVGAAACNASTILSQQQAVLLHQPYSSLGYGAYRQLQQPVQDLALIQQMIAGTGTLETPVAREDPQRLQRPTAALVGSESTNSEIMASSVTTARSPSMNLSSDTGEQEIVPSSTSSNGDARRVLEYLSLLQRMR